MERIMVVALAAIGIACILYGLLVASIASGTWFFAFWLALGALSLGGAFGAHAGWWAALPGPARWALGIAAVVLVVGFAATQALIMKDFNDQGEDGLDCVIVLGAQVREQGPSIVLRNRLDAALDYLERNPQARCVVSGGKGANEHASEASVMFDYLVAHGISPERVAMEDRSTNTSENIAFSKQLIDPATERVGIITNNFHVYRSVALARKAGFAYVTGIAAYSQPLFLPNNMVRESLSIAKEYLVGNL